MTESTAIYNTISNSKICYWELKDNTSYWSDAFLKVLGYDVKDITVNLEYFLDHIIHKANRATFRDNFYNLVRHDEDFKQNIQLLNSNGIYNEFICKTNDKTKIEIQENSKAVFFFQAKINTHDKVKNDFFYKEAATMTSTGSWYVDFTNKKAYWDKITRKILDYPEDFIPSLKMGYKLYAEEHQAMANEAFFNCGLSGKPFDLEILMVTSKNEKFWARAIGKPVFNDNKEITGIRGIFQDINEKKQRELHLTKTSEIVASQNSRLFNFAHIVSHNLRSHSSNLELIVQLIQSLDDPKDQLELIDNIKDVSGSLSKTIEHLNEVVTIQTNINKHREEVCIKSTLKQVCTSINQIVLKNNATINTDFSAGKTVNYIPAYMDSIILNLLTNSIKYKHPDRDPVITIKTYRDFKNDDRLVLEISDNGIGIDMKKYSDKLFGMYKTFHYNVDAVGIGLFITKNQIESLNGEIFVESEVDKGTTFTIKF